MNMVVETLGAVESLCHPRCRLYEPKGFPRDSTKSLEVLRRMFWPNRLRNLVRLRLVVTSQGFAHTQIGIYGLREKGIDLLLVR